jgi:hypothetical protein
LKPAIETEWLDVAVAGKDMCGRKVGSIDDELALVSVLCPGAGIKSRSSDYQQHDHQQVAAIPVETLDHVNVSSASGPAR